MSVTRVSAHSPESVDRVELIRTYAELQDQRYGNASATPPVPPAPPPDAGPLSAALGHPFRRPAFASVGLPARGDKHPRGRPTQRSDRFDEAVLPDWRRMEAGDRHDAAIPGNHRMEVPVQPDAVHGRRVGTAPDGHAATARLQRARVRKQAGPMGALARKAVLERARWLAVA